MTMHIRAKFNPTFTTAKRIKNFTFKYQLAKTNLAYSSTEELDGNSSRRAFFSRSLKGECDVCTHLFLKMQLRGAEVRPPRDSPREAPALLYSKNRPPYRVDLNQATLLALMIFGARIHATDFFFFRFPQYCR